MVLKYIHAMMYTRIVYVFALMMNRKQNGKYIWIIRYCFYYLPFNITDLLLYQVSYRPNADAFMSYFDQDNHWK